MQSSCIFISIGIDRVGGRDTAFSTVSVQYVAVHGPTPVLRSGSTHDIQRKESVRRMKQKRTMTGVSFNETN